MDIPPRVVIVAGDDVTSTLMLNKLSVALKEKAFEPVFLMAKRHKSEKAEASLIAHKRYAFFERDMLQDIIYPHIEDKGPKAQFNTFGNYLSPRMLAERGGFPYYDVGDVNSQDFIELYRGIPNVKLTLSLRCLQIFKRDTISACQEHGPPFLNLHPGLPSHRGLFSVARMMKDGSSQVGWMLHFVSEEIDLGDVVSVKMHNLNGEKCALLATIKMADTGVRAIMQTVHDISEDAIIAGTAQDPRRGKYYSYFTQDEINAFEENGLCFVNPTEVICRYARLFSTQGTEDFERLKAKMQRAHYDKEIQWRAERDAFETSSAPTTGAELKVV